MEDEELLEAYNSVTDRVSSLIQKRFDSEPLYLKTNIKKVVTAFAYQ